jgi:DNA-binding IclR family transcriptional regulator
MAVLNVLADSRADLGTNEIARRSGVNASSASRLLATLARSDLVRRDPDSGRYGLGLRLVELGNSALARIDLRDIARPHLLALMEATSETATLSVPGETTAMTLDFVQSPSSVRSVAEIGRPSVPHATAVGKVYLSFGGSLPDTRLVACTHRTITDRDKLEKSLAEVRERGWAEGLEERELGLNAVAAPVIDAAGVLVAILGLQGPSWRFAPEAMRAGASHLLEHAAELWRGPGR